MTRIFVDSSVLSDLDLEAGDVDVSSGFQLIELPTDLSHHLRDVLRLSVGKQIVVISSATKHEYLAIVVESKKESKVKVQLLRKLDATSTAPVVRTLACGLPKGSHADEICEKVSQLGVEQIVFWVADRSIVKPSKIENRLQRWQRICEASARQSRQNAIPQARFFEDSPAFISWLSAEVPRTQDLIALCSLSSTAIPFNAVACPTGRAHMVVGPEGDFSDREIAAFQECGAAHLSLGPAVLRVETAAIVAVAMGLCTWGWRH